MTKITKIFRGIRITSTENRNQAYRQEMENQNTIAMMSLYRRH